MPGCQQRTCEAPSLCHINSSACISYITLYIRLTRSADDESTERGASTHALCSYYLLRQQAQARRQGGCLAKLMLCPLIAQSWESFPKFSVLCLEGNMMAAVCFIEQPLQCCARSSGQVVCHIVQNCPVHSDVCSSPACDWYEAFDTGRPPGNLIASDDCCTSAVPSRIYAC